MLDKEPRSPRELFEIALKLRKEGSVRDYAAWLREARSELQMGTLSKGNERDIRRATRALERKLDVKPLVSTVSLKIEPAPRPSIETPI